MENTQSDELNRLIAVRAGIYAALEMHIRRSEELAAQVALCDEDIAKATFQQAA